MGGARLHRGDAAAQRGCGVHGDDDETGQGDDRDGQELRGDLHRQGRGRQFEVEADIGGDDGDQAEADGARAARTEQEAEEDEDEEGAVADGAVPVQERGADRGGDGGDDQHEEGALPLLARGFAHEERGHHAEGDAAGALDRAEAAEAGGEDGGERGQEDGERAADRHLQAEQALIVGGDDVAPGRPGHGRAQWSTSHVQHWGTLR